MSHDRERPSLDSGQYQITDRHALSRRRSLRPGVDYPRSGEELQRFLASEAAARRFLESVRWPRGFRCPECKARSTPERGPDGLILCGACSFLLRLTRGTLLEKPDERLGAWLRVLWEEAEGPVALGPDAVGELLAVEDPLVGALQHESLRRVEGRLVEPRLRGTCEVGLCRVEALGALRRGGRERVETHVLLLAEEASERLRLAHLEELELLGSALSERLLGSSQLVSRHAPLADAVRAEGFPCTALEADDIHHPSFLEPVAQRLRRWIVACPEATLSLLDGFLSIFAFRHERRLDPPGARFFRLASAAMEPLPRDPLRG